jgi:DNA processing protein
LTLQNLPLVLYVEGDETALTNELMISVVGARKASHYGNCVARALSSAMSHIGFTIVSGGALGIDSSAHKGALDEKGETICVLGCGLGAKYLMENKPLRDKIINNGALITEFPPYYPASRVTFPLRNRIISGISLGTVVVEAGERSGSLITANYALEQGRDVFAVPGDILFSGFTGANKLIRDGAKPVFSAIDVLGGYAMVYPELIDYEKIETTLNIDEEEVRPMSEQPAVKAEPVVQKKAEPDGLSENARKVYRAFENGGMQMEELIMKTGLSVSAFACAMTELELFDLVELQAGKNYKPK